MSGVSEDGWQTWWLLNRLALLPERTGAIERVMTAPDDGDALSPEALWRQRRSFVTDRHVAPFLRRLAAPDAKVRNEVLASALIALAKISHAPDDVALLLHHLEDKQAAQIVRESAALALGLLARTDPTLQMDAVRLDELRERLLVAFDDKYRPTRVRAFAALAIGLLGKQPYAGPYAKDGRLTIRALWLRLETCGPHQDLTVALLTALGMQPGAGVPDAVRDGLKRMVTGRRVHRRRWDAIEQSHALTALLRLGGAGTHAALTRTLSIRRTPADVRRAAYIALGELADGFTTDERVEAARIVRETLKHARDPLTTGLGHLALGHLLGADLRAGATKLHREGLGRELLREAKSGATPTRGFSALALGLAVRDVAASAPEVGTFLADAHQVLHRGLVGGRGDDRMRAAYAVAVGLAQTHASLDALVAVVEDRNADPELRGHAAVSLGQLGRDTPEVKRVLFVALAQRKSTDLRRQAALGLAFLGGRVVSTQLLRELDKGGTEQLLAQVVVALGRLGDLKAVAPLTEYASDADRSELAQALAAVALGMLGDPEPRPTLLRLTRHANYPARTDALHEALMIL